MSERLRYRLQIKERRYDKFYLGNRPDIKESYRWKDRVVGNDLNVFKDAIMQLPEDGQRIHRIEDTEEGTFYYIKAGAWWTEIGG